MEKEFNYDTLQTISDDQFPLTLEANQLAHAVGWPIAGYGVVTLLSKTADSLGDIPAKLSDGRSSFVHYSQLRFYSILQN